MVENSNYHPHSMESVIGSVDSLPNRPLHRTEYVALEEKFGLSAPMISDFIGGTVYAIMFKDNGKQSYTLYDPICDAWNIVVSVDNVDGGGEIELQLSHLIDEETGEKTPEFEIVADTLVENVFEYVKSYATDLYGESDDYVVDDLWFVFDSVDVSDVDLSGFEE